MDFSWALRKLKEGQAVRRESWDAYAHIPSEYAHVELVRDLPGFEPTPVVTRNDGSREPYRVNDQQLLAEDWRLAD
jgi:hypothetical protein